MYIYFDTFKTFQCSMCGQCCRNDWMVTLDSSSYIRNETIFLQTGRHEEFRQAFRQIASTSLGEYAQIAKQPNGDCWFLNSSNLCRLHQDVGHNHLDVVCQTFPRYPMNTTRGVELTLSFSCPTVLELASRASLELVRSDMIPQNLYSDNFATNVYPQQYPDNHLLRYYFEIEQHFIDILQWRSWLMQQRLNLICSTVDRLMTSKAENIGRELTRIINQNYDQFDLIESLAPPLDASDILIENYFVNSIFRKMFYDQGLKRGSDILILFWRQIKAAQENKLDAAAKWERISRAILELEFEYNHHRSRFTNRYMST